MTKAQHTRIKHPSIPGKDASTFMHESPECSTPIIEDENEAFLCNRRMVARGRFEPPTLWLLAIEVNLDPHNRELFFGSNRTLFVLLKFVESSSPYHP